MENEKFEAFAEKVIEEHEIPGVAVGLMQGQGQAYKKGFGFRDKEKGLPVTSSTVFGLASITKSFTCMAILQLQEQGKLRVTDPVTTYLPEFKTMSSNMEKVTIHHFMTHTSGLQPLDSHLAANKRSFEKDPSIHDYPGVKMKFVNRDPIDTYEQLMDYIASLDVELLGEPGEAFSYSNDAYGLLGAIITRVSGQAYESYVDEKILQPIGMKHSSFFPDPSFELTTLYAKRENEEGSEVYPAPVWWDAPAMRGTGAMKSSIDDMLTYAQVFLNHGEQNGTRILSAENIEEMMTPHVEMEPGRYYGYGFMIRPDYYGCKLVEHGGSKKAISSLLALVPERQLAGITLTNLAGVPASEILHAALNVQEGRQPEASHVVYPETSTLSVEKLKEYEGYYRSLEGMHVEARVENEIMKIQYQNETFEATPAGEDGFLISVRGENEYIRFVRNKNGEVIQVAFHYRQFPKVGEAKNKGA
ncbi:serine hydrolase domain-containing protein [Salsuginibacillus kocurii]|uniref:serine hydrolase domain-containing protein n=1 Tax=Salsuginibacillus kocurii TaxID=427078 RepID=UPI00037F7666|nr:serine hydrolase domain-containing protein [Salsuginibacillus kocurii]